MSTAATTAAAPPCPEDAPPVLAVSDLTTTLSTRAGAVPLVDRVSFAVGRGEILGLVGESGSGKTMTALSLMGLLPEGVRVANGSVRLGGRELVGLKESELRRLRGRELAMIFQEPMTSLDPCFSIGSQMAEAIAVHERVDRRRARAAAVDLLEQVGIRDAGARVDSYPHELSGGMRQRVMIATALLLRPQLLVADEPTTALDVTIQAQIIELLARLRDAHGMSIVLIAHDLAVIGQIADRVAVMYAGEIVESGPVETLLDAPRHPYTRALLRSLPELGTPKRPLPVIGGDVPEPGTVRDACRFAPRCERVLPRCVAEAPALAAIDRDHDLRCLNPVPDER